jgi:DNA invertase Pin-like site-specific DNA recombinase
MAMIAITKMPARAVAGGPLPPKNPDARLGRTSQGNAQPWFYVRRLANNGVRLVSITQELGDDPMSNVIRQIMALFDEYQSKDNAKQTLRAMARARACGMALCPDRLPHCGSGGTARPTHQEDFGDRPTRRERRLISIGVQICSGRRR